MSKLDPQLEEVLLALVRGLNDLNVRFCIVGALVPELLLDDPPPQATLDADAVVFVPDLQTFERVKNELVGFLPDERQPYRLNRIGGGRADLLPYGEQLTENGFLKLEPDHYFNMAGYDRIADASTVVRLASGDDVAVVTVPMYVLLKLVAYTDRRRNKDLQGVQHCLRHYNTDDDRRYGLTHADQSVPFEYGRAYLLGVDARPLMDDGLRPLIRTLMDKLAPTDSDDEDGDLYRERQDRAHLSWFRAGLAL